MNFINISQNSSLPQTTESGNYYRIADLHIFLGGSPPSTAKSITKTLPTFKNYSRKIKVFSVHREMRKKVHGSPTNYTVALSKEPLFATFYRAQSELPGCELLSVTDTFFRIYPLTTG